MLNEGVLVTVVFLCSFSPLSLSPLPPIFFPPSLYLNRWRIPLESESLDSIEIVSIGLSGCYIKFALQSSIGEK